MAIPKEHLRDKLNLGYAIKGQDILLEEIRPIDLIGLRVGEALLLKSSTKKLAIS